MVKEPSSIPRKLALQVALLHVRDFDLPKRLRNEVFDGAISLDHESQGRELTTAWGKWANAQIVGEPVHMSHSVGNANGRTQENKRECTHESTHRCAHTDLQ